MINHISREQQRRYDEALKHSLGGEFETAEQEFLALRNEFIVGRNLLDMGRAERDLTRVYAGLGRAVDRNAYAGSAWVTHQALYAGSSCEETAAELAASHHVMARLSLARMTEAGPLAGRYHVEEMIRHWSDAYRIVQEAGQTGWDYREQIAAHGSLAIACFGSREALGFASALAHDETIRQGTDRRRRKAAKVAGLLILARRCGVCAPARIKARVLSEVASPYVV